MSRVIMTCGKICCGKSTYARCLRQELGNAVILSIDEIMLAMFPEGAGERHEHFVRAAETYLCGLALQILKTGSDVILDWGLWTREQRSRLRTFWGTRGVLSEVHYLRISGTEWERRIRARNTALPGDPSGAYYVDEGLLRKVETQFEEPSADEAETVIDCG